MLDIVHDVTLFHHAGEVPGLEVPGFPGQDRVELRTKLIREEVGETLNAIEERDLVEVADGIADSIVVLVGTALEFGIDLTSVWKEVQRSNMAKFPVCRTCKGSGNVGEEEEHDRHCHDCEGRGTQILRREDGKILKPEGWAPPNIRRIVAPTQGEITAYHAGYHRGMNTEHHGTTRATLYAGWVQVSGAGDPGFEKAHPFADFTAGYYEGLRDYVEGNS